MSVGGNDRRRRPGIPHPQTLNARRRGGRNRETVQAKKFRGINDPITAHVGDQTSRFLVLPERKVARRVFAGLFRGGLVT